MERERESKCSLQKRVKVKRERERINVLYRRKRRMKEERERKLVREKEGKEKEEGREENYRKEKRKCLFPWVSPPQYCSCQKCYRVSFLPNYIRTYSFHFQLIGADFNQDERGFWNVPCGVSVQNRE
ncbi:hypothetical protein TNIN_493371 [Trichonephila inaurata madagascariensis]|uniref:Uncharacterized protein n=1 Tax=Trichonephila inaurata madagascariensis TaxID=2747483 RepID=A0A8X6IM69_9ARAC|nr:hypothetical protein TNIN_493371 [Trichonephila inaurata madagascariensis]